MTTMSIVGAALPRAEGRDKVTGHARYAADVLPTTTLFAKVLRSPYAHARIVRIDASAAHELPGVRAVITGKDVPGHVQGKRLRDMPVLCWDVVRFVGDRVAAVAADTEEIAEEALALIEVEYEELPAVTTIEEALAVDAPVLHPDLQAYDGYPADAAADGVRNGLSKLTWRKGDVDAGFAVADIVLEHTFTTPSRHHGYIEPHAGTVAIDDNGRVQVWTCTKSPFSTRSQLAKAVGIPEERVVVNVATVGGDFGGKGDAIDLPIAYFLAERAGRPVKVLMTYTEELLAGNPSHPSVITIKSGITRDGRILARHLSAYHASGAYGGFKPIPTVAIGGASHGAGPYRVENCYFEAIQVYTNTVPRGFFRAPGAPQVNFAVESHTDLLAQAVGMDPAEFRLRNILQEGDVNGLGHALHDVHAEPVLRGALDAAGWWTSKRPNVGRGIGMYERGIPGGPSGATISLESDGSVTVLSPTFDQGVGTHTILRQIVAERMEVPVDRVRVVIGNTDEAPFDGGVGGSRVTHVAGLAATEACNLLQKALAERAANLLECPVEEITYGQGALWPRETPARKLSLVDLAGAQPQEPLKVTARVNPLAAPDLSSFCAQVAEVEVDPNTGQVRLLRFVTAHDVGTVINPITHQGQIDGGVVQGIGMALTEELLEEGQVTTLHLGEYKLPAIADIPPLETVLVPAAHGPAPYEGRAIGEMANCSPPAAIANAIADAVGVRLFTIPLTAERVYQALKAKNA